MPAPADRQQAVKLIKEIFQDDYKLAKKAPEKIALAEKLLDQPAKAGLEQDQNPVSEARDRAREASNSAKGAGDDIHDRMAGQFAIDPLDDMIETLELLQKDTSPPATKKELAENLLPLAERAVAAQKIETARKLLLIALAAARNRTTSSYPKQILARGGE